MSNKTRGLTKPIKKKLKQVENLYNFYADACKTGTHINFGDRLLPCDLIDYEYRIKCKLTYGKGKEISYFLIYELLKNENHFDICRRLNKEFQKYCNKGSDSNE